MAQHLANVPRIAQSAGAILFAILLFATGSSAVAERAGEYGQFGPFDYYDPLSAPKDALSLVERAHFGPMTFQRAEQGDWCWYWRDLDYTLRAFPNHPRALMAMSDYLQKHRACPPPNTRPKNSASPYELMHEIENETWAERTPDYYFRAAIKFRPQYAATHVLYGRYLAGAGRREEALKSYHDAEKLEPNSSDVHYYLGLWYLDKGDYAKARFHAELAYKFGQTLPELKAKLIEVGYWKAK